MLNIYVTRHGQDEDNAHSILNGRRDTPLTEKGMHQAHELAQKIKSADLNFDHIYASPLQRAYTTAEVIAQTLACQNLTPLENLIERDFGIMTGKLQSQITELCSPNILQTDQITYFLSPENGETFPMVLDRAHQALEYVQARHPTGNILLVTHGDLGKMLYAAYYNLDWETTLGMFHFGNSELLLMSPSSQAEDVFVFHTEQFNT